MNKHYYFRLFAALSMLFILPEVFASEDKIRTNKIVSSATNGVQKLKLTSMCSEAPGTNRRWRIRNPNSFDVTVVWKVYGTKQEDTVIAPPGDSFFYTNTVGGANTTIIKWHDGSKWKQTVKASSGRQCKNPFKLNGNTLKENMPTGTMVGSFNKGGNSHVFEYKLLEGEADNHLFYIKGNELLSNTTFDYENDSLYTIKVRSTNTASQQTEVRTLEIKITDYNPAPSDIKLSANSIEEHLPKESLLAEIDVIDIGNKPNHVFAIEGVSNTELPFYIENNKIYTSTPLNYRVHHNTKIKITATNTDGGILSKTFTISVLNQPDPPSNLTLSVMEMSENTTANSKVAEISVEDKDALDEHIFRIIAQTDSIFSIQNNHLILNKKVDFETFAKIDVTLLAKDLDGDTVSKTFTVEVINENSPPTNIFFDYNIVELNETGDFLGTIEVEDADLNDKHTFRLADKNGNVSNDFYIQNDSVFNARRFYHHLDNPLHLNITAYDTKNTSITKSFDIDVINLPDIPTDINLSSNLIDEQRAASSIVGYLITTDINDKDHFTYKLIGNRKDNTAFLIKENRLLTAGIFDYHAQKSYSILVQVSDLDGDTFEKEFDIQVNNVINAPTDLNFIPKTSIFENNTVDQYLGKLIVKDADKSEQHTVELQETTTDANYFYLSGDSLFAKTSFDYEVQSNYALTFKVTDKDEATLNKTIQVQIVDVAETASGEFSTYDSLQQSKSIRVITEDFNNDGKIDAFVANQELPSTLWLNNGLGEFVAVQNSFSAKPTFDVAHADFDQDGDIDLAFANWFDINELWLNNGDGTFTKSDQTFGRNMAISITAADINNDGLQDVVIGSFNGINTTWLNQGNGEFLISAKQFGFPQTYALEKGDFDNDGDIDILEVSIGGNEKIWLNNGLGDFTQHPITIQTGINPFNADVQDFNNDGFLDIAFPNPQGGNSIWFNNGDATFINSGQSLGNENTFSLISADLDGDLDKDLVFANRNTPLEIWLNNGHGQFSNSGQSLSIQDARSIGAADLDQDKDTDLFIVGNDAVNYIWFNNTKPSGITLSNHALLENSRNSFIGKIEAIDPDSNDSFTFWLPSHHANNALFTISNDSLYSQKSLDHEQLKQIEVLLAVKDNHGDTAQTKVNIEIIDVNEAPTFSIDSVFTFNSGAQIGDIFIADIFTGDESFQNLRFEVEHLSNNIDIIDSYFSYFSPYQYGYLYLEFAENGYGTDTLLVSLIDDGGIMNGGENTASKTIIVHKEQKAVETGTTNFTLNTAPNPATNFINLSIADYSMAGSNIYVYNMSGEVVLSDTGNSEELTLDISQLQSGIHIIHIEHVHFSMTERFMKE